MSNNDDIDEKDTHASSPSSGVSDQETPEPPAASQHAAQQGSSKRGKRWLIARRVVQVASLLLFSLPLLVAGWQLLGQTPGADVRVPTPADLVFYGSLSSSSILGFDLMDPFAALQISLAAKEFLPAVLLAALPLLIFYTLIRARAFCGWVCPVNLVLELIDFIRTKLGIKVKERVLSRRVKIGVAAAVLLISALVSFPLFEAFSPISFINKGIIAGSTVGLVTFIAIIIVELFWAHRVWCRALCPVGGLYEVLGRLGLVNVRMEYDKCIHCGICQNTCLSDPVILDEVLEDKAQAVLSGDCMLCGACVDKCPTQALAIKIGLDHYGAK